MSRINVLDDNMINMIAAGEVIERPASVVKELLENSIDAGSTKITLTVEDGGRKLISVTDNGNGIEADDIELAFKPHATSKIKTSDDLFKISTLGFRGEALASIAAVSQVSITSRTPDSIGGNTLSIDSGDFSQVKPASSDVGTTIEVRNLFYKLPARRKFMRTANTEMGHISEQFIRIALANCQLDLTLINNGRQIHRLVANQSLRDRITALFNKSVSEDLLETSSDEKNLKIHALLGHPAAARATSKFQYVFLNGRFIRDKFITHALKEAYRGQMEPNKFPVVFIFLQLSPDDFDVNVHPTKMEVRFTNSNLVHSQILAVLREKLLSTNLDVNATLPTPSPSDNFTLHTNQPDEQEARKQRIRKAMADFFKNNQPSQTQQSFNFKPSSSPKPYSPPRQSDFQPQSRPAQSMPQTAYNNDSITSNTTEQPPIPQSYNLQIHNSYIITQTEEGFAVVDQHALHERIIYEDLKRKLETGTLQSQRLLIPETLDIDTLQQEAINENADLIAQLGIEIEPFGPNTIAIHAFPTKLGKLTITEFMQDLLDKLTDKTIAPDAEKLLHEILDMASCKAAIKAGNPLTPQEISELIARKEEIDRSSRCPHGRPTTIHFSIADLEKQFKRTGF